MKMVVSEVDQKLALKRSESENLTRRQEVR
jgi:hypothetical protein